MSEELKPQELIVLTFEEQISQELVRANVTEAVIAELRERYMGLKIADINDKETYGAVKVGRKECKSLRVMAKKICTNGREEATAIQKAWIAKEKEVTGRIAEVEDYLEAQEKEYEAGIAAEKEARKRKQEEQLILRQQELTGIGVLYSDGRFSLGDVSFELSAIKESDNDIWNETIWPLYKQAYEAIEADRIEQERVRKEMEAELKREKEELEQKKKELAEEAVRLQKESERQAAEARKAVAAKELARTDQLLSLGLKFDFFDHFKGYDCFVPILDLRFHDDAKWSRLIEEVTAQVARKKADEAEEKRKEQERKELQNKRYAELLPFDKFGDAVEMDRLFDFPENQYLGILERKKAAFQKAEEERDRQIAESAAKKERERIEEEQRQALLRRINELGETRMGVLKKYNAGGSVTLDVLGNMNDATWDEVRKKAQDAFDELTRKQEEERKAEELAQASEKVKWAAIIRVLDAIVIPPMRSNPYRKKAAILREKLEEIKAL